MKRIRAGKTNAIFFVLLVLLGFSKSTLATAPIVKDGEPVAAIVLSLKPNPVALEAANELQRVIERISGATLPIFLEHEWIAPGTKSMTRIFVGDSATAQEAGLDMSGLAPEGFVVKVNTSFSPTGQSRPPAADYYFQDPPGKTYPAIILAGRDDPIQTWGWCGDRANLYLRGTAYAVYAFLEKDLGVRWLWPGELGEVVPRMKNIDIAPIDRSDAPKLSRRIFRNIREGSVVTSPGAFVRKTRQESRWLDHMRLGDSSNHIQPSRYGIGRKWQNKGYDKTHPEYFALQLNGKRLLKRFENRVRLCLSNPEVINLIAADAIKTFDEYPRLTMHGIELSDVYGSYCRCENCKAWGPAISDIVARHWNAVAERIAAKHPDKLLCAHPYNRHSYSPQSVKKIHDNIVLYVASDENNGYTVPGWREQMINGWLGWAKLSKRKVIWRCNYTSKDLGMPLSHSRKMSEDLKLFYSNNLGGVEIEKLQGNWSGSTLDYYTVGKMFWDPQLDYEAIVEDYCKKGFGPAAKAIRSYFDQLERISDAVLAHKPTGTCPMGLNEYTRAGLAYHFTAKVTSKLNAMLDRAVLAAGDDDIVKARIEFLRAAVKYAEVEHRTHMAGRSLDSNPQPSQDEIDRVKQILDERAQFLTKYAGRLELEPRVIWNAGSTWVKQIIDNGKSKDIFADLWTNNEEVMTLPEDWRFATDSQAVGLKEKWYAKDYDDSAWKTIKVGDFWERQGYKNYDGIAWYRCKLTLPKTLKGKKVLFAFGAADEAATVFIDGTEAGKHDIGIDGWDQRFVLDMTEYIKPGVEQAYAIMVIDSSAAGGLWRPIKVMTPR